MPAESFATLEEFRDHFLSHPLDRTAIPRDGLVFNFGEVITVALYRRARFQAELVISPAPVIVDDHRHPGVESYEIAFGGDMHPFVNGRRVHPPRAIRAWLSGRFGLLPPLHIGSDEWHGGYSGSGAAFLSLQRWADGLPITSVGENWIANPAGADYAAIRAAGVGLKPENLS